MSETARLEIKENRLQRLVRAQSNRCCLQCNTKIPRNRNAGTLYCSSRCAGRFSREKLRDSSKAKTNQSERGAASFYVYFHVDPVTGVIFYIGKGTAGRAWTLNSRRPSHKDWIKTVRHVLREDNTPKYVQIVHANLSEQEAFSLEKNYQDMHGAGFIPAKYLSSTPKAVNSNDTSEQDEA